MYWTHPRKGTALFLQLFSRAYEIQLLKRKKNKNISFPNDWAIVIFPKKVIPFPSVYNIRISEFHFTQLSQGRCRKSQKHQK